MSWARDLEDAAITSSMVCWGYLVGVMIGSALGQPLICIPIMFSFFAARGRIE
jgi:hypothetical protein